LGENRTSTVDTYTRIRKGSSLYKTIDVWEYGEKIVSKHLGAKG